MRGHGKEVEEGGSSRGSTSREAGQAGQTGSSNNTSEAAYLAMFARSGLSMLAGHVRPNTQPRFGTLDTHTWPSMSAFPAGDAAAAAAAGDKAFTVDVVRRLSVDECWRLILQLGTRWPAWTGPPAVQANLEVKIESDDTTFGVGGSGHCLPGKQPNFEPRQQEQAFVKLLADRALKALATRAPPSRVSRADMLAPKPFTAEERLHKNLATGDVPKTWRTSTPPTLPVTWSAKASTSTSSQEMPAPKSAFARPRVAELTIFYDGIVNVCNNVPADKARLIMMYAEKAGLSSQAGARARCGPPPSVLSHAGPSQRPNRTPLSSGLSASPLGDRAKSVAHVGVSTSEPANVGVSKVDHGKAPIPVNFTVSSRPPRQVRQNVMLKPLPNARRNSLARFLDSKKRSRGIGAPLEEELTSKKLAIGEGGPSDVEALKGDEKPSIPSNVVVDQPSLNQVDMR